MATVVFDPRTEGTVTRFTIQAVSLEQHRGGIATKEVTVLAPVRLPDGTSVRKTLVITMRRTAIGRGQPTSDAWIITGVRDASSRQSALQAGSSRAYFARSVFCPTAANRTTSLVSSSRGSMLTTLPTPNCG